MATKRSIGILLGLSGAMLATAMACSNSSTSSDGAGGEGGAATGGSSATGGKTNTGGSTTGGSSSTGGSISGGGNGGAGGEAGSAECVSYCDFWFEKGCNDYVTQDYDDKADCLATCAGFATNGSDGTYSGNNVQCRVSHVQANPSSTHCEHAQETPTENCVDPT